MITIPLFHNKITIWELFMSSYQLQTLMKDSEELGLYAEKLLKKGKDEVAMKILKKQKYLDKCIEEAKVA